MHKINRKWLKLFSVILLPLVFWCFSPITFTQGFGIPKNSASDVWPTDEWLTSTPEEQQMNSTRLLEMYDFIYDNNQGSNTLDIGSVLIIRNGIIVEEAYLEDGQVNEALTQPSDDYNWGTLTYQGEGKLRNWFSTTKTIASILIGIAIQNGFIDNVSQKLFDIFSDKWDSSYEPRKQNITIEHLLTMTSGVPWEFNPTFWISYDAASNPNYLDDVLALNLTQDPGGSFNNYTRQYSTDATNLLTAILNRTTGMYPEDFARQYLFEPLGIPDTDWGWYKDGAGINFGGSGLCMHRRSMAKIAYLCLRNGNWDGTQILSTEYLQKATTDHDGIINETYMPYGYLFWLDNFTTDYSWYSALGAFGQNFYVIPDLDLIILFNGFDYYDNISDAKEIIIRDYIIPSIYPIITDVPSDFTVEVGYTGVSIEWTATDTDPNTYTIELQGTGVVVDPTAWSSGVAISYNVPDGFLAGTYTYIVNFTDDFGDSNTDEVIMTVQADTADPIITSAPSDVTVQTDYTGESISWTATDANPGTYTITLNGTTIVTATAWTSDTAVTYNIPDDLPVGLHTYEITFSDSYGNSVSDTVVFTVEQIPEDDVIPGYELPIVLGVFTIASIGLIVLMKKKYK